MNSMTTAPMGDFRTAARKFAESRRELAQLVGDMAPEKLAALADIFSDEGSVPQVSNVERLAVGPVSTEGRPSLKQAIIIILKDAGKALNAGTIVAELLKRQWLPVSEKPRVYVSHVLSTHKDIFIRDPEVRGLYSLAEGTPTPKAKAAKPSKGSSGTAPKKTASDATMRVTGILQKSTKPFTIRDLTKAAKIDDHRKVHFLMLNLERLGAVSRLKKRAESGLILWQIERKAFNEFVKRQAA